MGVEILLKTGGHGSRRGARAPLLTMRREEPCLRALSSIEAVSGDYFALS